MDDLTVDPLRGAPRSYISRGKGALGIEMPILLQEHARGERGEEREERGEGREKRRERRQVEIGIQVEIEIEIEWGVRKIANHRI